MKAGLSMKFLFPFIFIASIVFSVFSGRLEQVTNAVLGESLNAAELFITLAASMAFWGGIMKIAEKSGFTNIIARLFKPLAKLLFPNLSTKSKAFKAIVMNLTANLLGLGNAATPLGIEAVKELSKEERSHGYATKNIITFVVMNTASIQLLPVTIATLRLSSGSSSPFDIIPCVIITSLVSVCFGIFAVKALCSERNLKTYAKRKIADECN